MSIEDLGYLPTPDKDPNTGAEGLTPAEAPNFTRMSPVPFAALPPVEMLQWADDGGPATE